MPIGENIRSPKSCEVSALRKIALVVVVGFLVVSFGFMGGWPFRSQEGDASALSRNDDSTPDENASETMPNDGLVENQDQVLKSLVKEPAKKKTPAAVRASRDYLSTSKAEGVDAHRLALSESVLNNELPRPYRFECMRTLRQLNQDSVFRPGYFSGAVDVKIVAGDSLTRIARRVKKTHGNNVTSAFLMKMNRMPNTQIRAGNLISVPTESLKVVISKSDFRLYVLLGESVVLDYAVGIGHSNSTPEGEFVVQGKTKNPTWTRPDGSIVRFGEEGHTIGNRWLGFSNSRGRTPYGIHGTVEDESIGKEESEGCIRMLKIDVEEIFRLVPEGCAVEIRL